MLLKDDEKIGSLPCLRRSGWVTGEKQDATSLSQIKTAVTNSLITGQCTNHFARASTTRFGNRVPTWKQLISGDWVSVHMRANVGEDLSNGSLALLRYTDGNKCSNVGKDGNSYDTMCLGTWQTLTLSDAISIKTLPIPTAVTPPMLNIAKNKPTSQSSTGWEGVSQRAVDGQTNGNYQIGESCTHTNVKGGWWKVDLQGTHSVNAVKLYNRDQFQDRMNGAKVYVGEHLCGAVANDQFSAQGTGEASVTIVCNGKPGSFVKVEMAGHYLSLCEVEVYSIPCGCVNSPACLAQSDNADVSGPCPPLPPTVPEKEIQVVKAWSLKSAYQKEVEYPRANLWEQGFSYDPSAGELLDGKGKAIASVTFLTKNLVDTALHAKDKACGDSAFTHPVTDEQHPASACADFRALCFVKPGREKKFLSFQASCARTCGCLALGGDHTRPANEELKQTIIKQVTRNMPAAPPQYQQSPAEKEFLDLSLDQLVKMIGQAASYLVNKVKSVVDKWLEAIGFKTVSEREIQEEADKAKAEAMAALQDVSKSAKTIVNAISKFIIAATKLGFAKVEGFLKTFLKEEVSEKVTNSNVFTARSQP